MTTNTPHVSPVLAVEHLTKRYGKRQVIDDLSFMIERGERLTIFAPSGAGKTTLLTLINRLDPDFEGRISLTAENASTIFQEPRLFPYMTVQENIFFPLRVKQMPKTPPLLRQYKAWLEVCGLIGQEQQYPYQLSGGMKQKVSLIRSFLFTPDFLMMDEPFKSIDLRAKQQIIRFIRDNYPDITILFVTHNLDEIPLLAHSLMVFPGNTLGHFVRYSDISGLSISDMFSRVLQHFS